MSTITRTIVPLLVKFNRLSSSSSFASKQFHQFLPVSIIHTLVLPTILSSPHRRRQQNCKRDISQSSILQRSQPTHWGQNKAHRKVKLNLHWDTMTAENEQLLAPLRESVKEQVFFYILFFFLVMCECSWIPSLCPPPPGRPYSQAEGWRCRRIRCEKSGGRIEDSQESSGRQGTRIGTGCKLIFLPSENAEFLIAFVLRAGGHFRSL